MLFRPTRFLVMLAGISALILSMGIARYALTPMLPVMKAQLDINEFMAGLIAGLTYIGYLSGLFIVWLMGNLQVKDFFYRYGLVVAVIATAFIAASDVELVWYAARFFAGVAGATGFMLGTGLVLNWLYHNDQKPELGFHFSGIGIGIVVSALVVDFLTTQSLTAIDWRIQWVVLAGVGAMLFLPAFFLMPFPKPNEVEMARRDLQEVKQDLPSMRWLVCLTIAYFCAGMSTTVNVTFNSLITELRPELTGWGTKSWLLVGLAATPAPIIWDLIARRINNVNALVLAFIIAIAGNIILASFKTLGPTLLASILFGFSFMGIVSMTLSTVGRRYGTRATQVMARLTLVYCISQVLAPILTGYIANQLQSFSLPLYLVSGFLMLGLVCLFMIRHEHDVLRSQA